MGKFYEVFKVLDKRTDTCGRVQFLVRWRGYGKKYDSRVDEADTNVSDKFSECVNKDCQACYRPYQC